MEGVGLGDRRSVDWHGVGRRPRGGASFSPRRLVEHVPGAGAEGRVTAYARDLSVTALYTSAAWTWGGLANAELFDHPDARRVFRAVNTVLTMTRPFTGVEAPLPIALLHRHTLIDVLIRSSGTQRVLELAAGLSRRGGTLSAPAAIGYVGKDRAPVARTKRQAPPPT